MDFYSRRQVLTTFACGWGGGEGWAEIKEGNKKNCTVRFLRGIDIYHGGAANHIMKHCEKRP
jgi:hypothetical protein